MNQKSKSTPDAKRPLDRLVMWLRWPENKLTGTVPWFVIAWRLPWMPFVYTGLAIAWFGVAMANGVNQANYFWRKAT
jgi:hypothetical protein